MIHRIACFISPHGFGHATRTIAVLAALRQRCPEVVVDIFTTVPEHLFAASLKNYTYHFLMTDIGLVQHDALQVDIEATVAKLDETLPFAPELLEQLAAKIRGCNCVLCDIAPLGIATAKKARIPSLLLENFTWDWIYQSYQAQHPALDRHIAYLHELYASVTYHVQTEPICHRTPANLHCAPIARKWQSTPAAVHRRLNTAGRKLIVVTLGGITTATPQWQAMEDHQDCLFVLAGQAENGSPAANVMLLAQDSDIYHPDLIQAADLVVCKTGYSTIAECCQAGRRLLCVGRNQFPESAVLADFVASRLNARQIDSDAFISGAWLSLIAELLSTPPPKPFSVNGSQAVASFIAAL